MSSPQPKRKDLPPAVKKRVLARYGGVCAQCGSDDRPEVDHIVPWSISRDDSEDNLQVLCFAHNRRKGNKMEGDRTTWFHTRYFPNGPVTA